VFALVVAIAAANRPIPQPRSGPSFEAKWAYDKVNAGHIPTFNDWYALTDRVYRAEMELFPPAKPGPTLADRIAALEAKKGKR
jgi:hypothetical protein